jgi:hypothetical protein
MNHSGAGYNASSLNLNLPIDKEKSAMDNDAASAVNHTKSVDGQPRGSSLVARERESRFQSASRGTREGVVPSRRFWITLLS